MTRSASAAARRARRWLTGVTIVLIATGCAPAADGDAGRSPASGVRGVTVVDIGCPTLTTAASCPTRPIPARLRFTRPDSATAVAELQTSTDGTFTLELAPGRYHVLPTTIEGTPLPSAQPLTVEVMEGQFTQLTVQFDSGIR